MSNYGQVDTVSIKLRHVVLNRSGDDGTFESFGFASPGGLLAASVRLHGGVRDRDYDDEAVGEWGIDFIIHIPTGFAVWPFRCAQDIDPAMRLLEQLDKIPGWERTDPVAINGDLGTRDAVRAVVSAWADAEETRPLNDDGTQTEIDTMDPERA